jgi:hypothetical protein
MLEFTYDDGDSAAVVSRLLREHALIAAESVAHLSVHARNERVRMQAATYIIDKVLSGRLDADIKLAQAQVGIVGQALTGVVRALGLRFGFDPDDPAVKAVAQETLVSLAGTAE